LTIARDVGKRYEMKVWKYEGEDYERKPTVKARLKTLLEPV
jgi:hypothetical protein